MTVSKILFICDTDGIAQAERTRREWEKNGFTIEVRKVDTLTRKMHLDDYFLIAFTMNHDNCDLFFKYSKIIRGVTNTPIVFFPYGKYSESEELKLVNDGESQVFDLNSHVKLNIANCIVMIKHFSNTLDENNDVVLWSAENFFLDINRYVVYIDNREVSLTKLEFNILHYLMQHRDHIMSYDQVYSSVWGEEYTDSCRSILWNHIKELRKKLQWHPGLPEYIITKRGVGYSFSPQI